MTSTATRATMAEGAGAPWRGLRGGLWQLGIWGKLSALFVSGYAVNFVRLSREQQMDVVNRTFHGA